MNSTYYLWLERFATDPKQTGKYRNDIPLRHITRMECPQASYWRTMHYKIAGRIIPKNQRGSRELSNEWIHLSMKDLSTGDSRNNLLLTFKHSLVTHDRLFIRWCQCYDHVFSATTFIYQITYHEDISRSGLGNQESIPPKNGQELVQFESSSPKAQKLSIC